MTTWWTLSRKMRMSYVYQLLMIKALLAAGGTATPRQVVLAFLSEDESKIAFYERRIRVCRSLYCDVTGWSDERATFFLEGPKLTYQQSASLRALCEKRIGDFLESRGV